MSVRRRHVVPDEAQEGTRRWWLTKGSLDPNGGGGSHWKDCAPTPPPGTTTFAGQAALGRLPVPELERTAAKLKRALRALAWDEDEYRTSMARVEAFVARGGVGAELQRRLVGRREEPGRLHWLEEWWDEGAYFGYREPVMINVSYYYGFDEHPAQYPHTAAHRAAALTRGALLFRRQLKRGLLPPDTTKEGPLCMDTWRWMFDCARVPVTPVDQCVSYAQEGDLGDTGHIVVFRKGLPWRVDVAPHGQLLSTQDLLTQFQHIYDNTTGEYPGVGALTSSHRDIWAKNYTLLASDAHNAAILQAIHSAAFVVSLDTERPENVVHFSRALWHGGLNGDQLGNRWFDKPANLVVFDNVQAGVVGEHSVMDGTPMARMCDEIVEDLRGTTFDHGVLSKSAVAPPEALNWKVTPTLLEAIERAYDTGRQLIETQTMGYLLTSYGKAAIKQWGVSPDGWTQMMIQLAYRRLLGKRQRPGGTYEAATTRRFLKGRTETIRSVSVESERWVDAMVDESASVEKKKRLLAEAVKVHGRDAREAGMAMGIDRHMLGLKKMLREGEKMPELFEDPLYLRSGHWVLSTSTIPARHFPAYGWGEVVPDGFGVAYLTGHDDRLQFTVTSRKEMPNAKFIEELSSAAEEMRVLFEAKSRL